LRFGIVSDIHGNLAALDAVLRLLADQGAERYVCCGDLVGYGPEPAECIERVRSLGATTVAGNHDHGVVGKLALDRFNAAAEAALGWTTGRINDRGREYLDSLPLTAAAGPLFVVHASPTGPGEWRYVVDRADADAELDRLTGSLCVLGHTHVPVVWERVGDGPVRRLPGQQLVLREDAKYLVNAGSVGQPRDGDPRACCMLYDEGSRELAIHRVGYDIAGVQRLMLDAGLPVVLATRLAAGF